jgi:hypothetical protein
MVVAARATEEARAMVGEVMVSAMALTAAVVIGGEWSERVRKRTNPFIFTYY